MSHICVLSVWLHKSFSILNESLYWMLGWIVKGEQNGHFHSIPVLCLVMCNSLGAESFSPGVSQHLSDVTVSNSWYRALNVFRITVSFFPVWYSLTGTVMLHPFHPCYINQWEIQLFLQSFMGKSLCTRPSEKTNMLFQRSSIVKFQPKFSRTLSFQWLALAF